MSRVLIVDDEANVRDLACRAVAEVGLLCDTAENGREATRRFERGQYGSVVTDLKMPLQHGHSLAIDLLGRSDPPSVVVMTGVTDQRLLQDLIRNGVHDVFWKPFDYQSLAMRLLTLAEIKRRQPANPRAVSSNRTSSELGKIEQALMEITPIFFERLANLFEFDQELFEPPPAVTDFIVRFAKLDEEAAARYANKQGSRRQKVRVACDQTVTVVPVSSQLAPEGEPFMAAIQDVSEGGIRLLHTRAVNAKFLALSWRAETLPYANFRLVAKVVRCQARTPFYSIGAEFVLAD